MPEADVLTLREVALLLRVAQKTVYVMAQRREIPAFKVRGQWRFRRQDIERWIDQKTDAEGPQNDSEE